MPWKNVPFIFLLQDFIELDMIVKKYSLGISFITFILLINTFISILNSPPLIQYYNIYVIHCNIC